jgi:hypothetical protein
LPTDNFTPFYDHSSLYSCMRISKIVSCRSQLRYK